MQALAVIFWIAVIGSIVLDWLGSGSIEHGWLVLWHIIERIGESALLIWAGFFVYSKRDPIVRWYYFTFHPHPAEPLVRAAIASSNIADGKALAAALSELPPGDPIFRSVRLAQAERLFSQMQAMSARRLREFEAHAKAEYERAALLSIQEAVALAAVALERAKALYRASQRI